MPRWKGLPLLVLVLVAASCAQRTQPSLEAALDRSDAAQALELATGDDELPPGLGTSAAPILLGFDSNFDREGTPLAESRRFGIFELATIEPELTSGDPTSNEYDAAAGEGTSTGDVPGSQSEIDPLSGSESDDLTQQPSGVDGAAVGSDVEVATTDEPFPTGAPGSEGADAVVVLPPPPPAAPGMDPGYDDPSPAVVFASGRPVELFGAQSDSRTVGVSDDTIRIAGLISQTIAGLPHRGDACLGAEARANQANVNEELSRTIEFVKCLDDAGQSNLSNGMAQSLVRDDDVFALAPVASRAFLGDIQLNEQHVPYVGIDPLPGFCGRTSTFGYGVVGAADCPVLDARGYVALVEPVLSVWNATRGADPDPISLVIATEDSASGTTVADQRLLEAALIGLDDVVALQLLPDSAAAQPETWDDVAQRIIDRDPGVVFLDGTEVAGLPAVLRREGFFGEVVLVGVVDPLLAADEEWRTGIAPATVLTPGLDLATRSAGWESMEGAALSVGLESDGISLAFIEGYLAMDFLVQAVDATAEPLSAESLHDRINAGWWYPGVAGLACGSWWPASHFIESPCLSVSAITVDDTAPVPIMGLVQTMPQLQFNLNG